MSFRILHQRSSLASMVAYGALVAMTLIAVPLLAEDGGDPITDQLVRMLEAELSEEIILEWLESQPLPSEPLTADDLVALKSAGASDDLMKELLALSRREVGEEPSAPEATPTSATIAPGPAIPSTPEATRPPSPSPVDTTDPLVTFRLSYLHRTDESEVGDDGPAWNLFIYLDGFPVTSMTGAEFENRPTVMEFARTLPTGEHTIRVLQERHRRKGSGWQHESRVARSSFDFELDPQAPAWLEVEFHERFSDYSDPLTFKLTQGAQIIDSGRLGGEAEFWPALCEDIEVSVPAGKKPNRSQRQDLQSCLRWGGLWGDDTVPPRQEVLDAMARFDFKPTPKGS